MFQRLVLIGNLTADPEMRYTPSGTAVTNFNLATSKKLNKGKTIECPNGWKDGWKGKNWEQTTFWRCTAWRGLAETINTYCKKGSQIYIEGEVIGDSVNGVMNPRMWTNNEGVTRASFEVRVQMCKFLGGRSSDSGSAQGEPPPELVEETDIPF